MAKKTIHVDITLKMSTLEIITILAEREDTSIIQVLEDLIQEGLLYHENLALAKLADKLDGEEKDTVSHEEAWN